MAQGARLQRNGRCRLAPLHRRFRRRRPRLSTRRTPTACEVTASASVGKVTRTILMPNPHINGFRAFVDVQVEPGQSTDVRAFLHAGPKKLTETWLDALDRGIDLPALERLRAESRGSRSTSAKVSTAPDRPRDEPVRRRANSAMRWRQAPQGAILFGPGPSTRISAIRFSPGGDHRRDRGRLGANSQRISGVFHIAAGKDRAAFRAQGGADGKARIGRIGSLLRRPGLREQIFDA